MFLLKKDMHRQTDRQTDRQTVRRTNRQGDSYINPQTSFAGSITYATYNGGLIKGTRLPYVYILLY